MPKPMWEWTQNERREALFREYYDSNPDMTILQTHGGSTMKPIIEKNIPIPRRQGKKATWAALVDNMDVGDSVLVNNGSERASLTNASKAQGYEVTTRKEDDKFRVWRLS